jgi:hypothetical protein
MARKDPSVERLRSYGKARRKSKGGHLGDLEAVAERMRELAEELRTTTDRTRVLAVGEERRVLSNLIELYGAADEVESMDSLAKQLEADRSERHLLEAGVRRASQDPLESWPAVGEETEQ